MERIEQLIREFLKENSYESISKLVNAEHKHLYHLVASLFKKNGIHSDRFSYEDFPSYLYVALVTHREELLILANTEENFFKVISRIANIMLKELNRELYREEVRRKKEFVTDNIEQFHAKERVEVKNEGEELNLDDALQSRSAKVELVLKLYFGINRSYKLNADQICSIIRIKRSSLFLKVKEFKDEIRLPGYDDDPNFFY